KAGMQSTAWPVHTAPQLPLAILPSHRIVAFYGNPLSKKMGILGELPPDQMLARFDKVVAAWTKADPNHPVQPALHLIAVVVQRFTRKMLTDAKGMKLDPRVQVVINMEGWGQPWLKYDSYRAYVEAEPVQFTGFKLFYHNDTKKGDPLLTPPEVLMLNPKPLYIQYQ